MKHFFYRKAIKAVGLLFGFLGFSNFIFFFNPNDGSAWEHAYYIINALLQSSQASVIKTLVYPVIYQLVQVSGGPKKINPCYSIRKSRLGLTDE